ncbi:MAG: hypothetical protein GWO07_00195 [Candidatus Dadabacteria bacterium]|nr:hypothetical protein [Candidatus Dadabacteria bacterium]NIV43270.1 hypothetical protein [Candidatus Dadabacteria bacterium]NIX14342.1 hypothetical protein [Candidatus Dadabacteria bacterium]
MADINNSYGSLTALAVYGLTAVLVVFIILFKRYKIISKSQTPSQS